MQRGVLALQHLQRGNADLQVLPDRALVERVGGARQLDLAVQRLVGDAEQRPIGHAHAEALRRDRRRFHVDRDGARQVDAAALLRPAQLPVSVVVGDDGAGAQPPLQRLAAVSGDVGDRRLQRDLHFGERGDRHVGRHRLVEDIVLPQVSVREHVVADLLALPQARAMADHQPAMRAKHRDVIGDRLGVGGADADVDEADAAPILAYDVIGGHLVAMPDKAGDERIRFGLAVARLDRHIAGQHELLHAGAGAQLLEAPADELVDITVIVGQQHPGLHRAPVGACVVHESAQRIVGSSGIEQRERALRAGSDFEQAVGDFIPDNRERRRGEMTREFRRGHAAAAELVAGFEDIGVGDFLGADADLDFGAEFRHERLELLQQIGAEILRLRHRRRIHAGRREFGEGARARGRRAVGAVAHAQARITEARAHLRARRDAGIEELVERRTKRMHRAIVALGQQIDG